VLDPNYALAYLYRGSAYYELGDHKQSIADLERGLGLGVEPGFEQQAEALLASGFQ